MKRLLLIFLMAGALYAGNESTTGQDLPRAVIFYAATGMCFSFLVRLIVEFFEDTGKAMLMLWHASWFAILNFLVTKLFGW